VARSATVPFDLVIFDCDGVLVDSEVITVEIESRLLTEMGWPLEPAEVVRRFMGRTDVVMLAEIAAQLGAEAAARFERDAGRAIERAFAERLHPVDGVVELVHHVQAAGRATCIASSGGHAKLRRTLGLTGLWPLFEGRVFSADDVAHGKPAPDLLLHAAAVLRADPARCAVIEDSVNGVRAAVAAGMTPFGFAGGLTPASELAEAGATVFQHMRELHDRL
jgi:HAD superfamily hydrolase (TIGR01509 family)